MPQDEDEIRRVDQSYKQLLANNRAWVEQEMADDPEFFARLAKGQRPRFLWIGCSDSRVPANMITGTEPGDMFVHRNVANLVVHTDLNMLSVLQYAVEVLRVQHVIVCGHYGCGGVASALTNSDYGLINKWLRHIKDVHRLHARELEALEPAARERRLVELNVAEGVYNIGKTDIVQRAWDERGYPHIHGWAYDIADGLIHDLGVNFGSAEALEESYRYTFDSR